LLCVIHPRYALFCCLFAYISFTIQLLNTVGRAKNIGNITFL
jgi:hypothetical protein